MANGGVGGQKKGGQSEDLTQDSWPDLVSCIYVSGPSLTALVVIANLISD
jgi:hypothetical protein